jgi:hypothetical protein
MNVKEKLAEALTKAGAPPAMIQAAARGRYADFESPSATPITDLVYHSRAHGLDDIAQRAANGEFDGE